MLGVLVIKSEYSTGSIQTSLAAVPRRGRFLAAKATVRTAVSLITGEATALTVFLLGQALGAQVTAVIHGTHELGPWPGFGLMCLFIAAAMFRIMVSRARMERCWQ